MIINAKTLTAGRYLHALAVAGGNPDLAAVYSEGQNWTDRSAIVKAATAASVGSDFAGDYAAVSGAFLEAMRGYSIPGRLAGMRRVPFRQSVFKNAAGVVAVEIAEGAPAPVLRGDWSVTSIEPRAFAGIVVQTNELLRSQAPEDLRAITDDLAEATAEAENLEFISPLKTGSVLYGAPSFSSTGTSVSAIDADLRALVDAVPGADKPGCAWVVAKETAMVLSIARGSGGARAYPDITPQGGTLLGIPVLVTSACGEYGSPPTRVIGLISSSEILWAGGDVELTTSDKATLQMLDNPTNSSTTPTPTSQVSMFQAGCTATKAVRRSGWYARSGAAAYFTAGY